MANSRYYNRIDSTNRYADVSRMKANTLKMLGYEDSDMNSYIEGNTVKDYEYETSPRKVDDPKKKKARQLSKKEIQRINREERISYRERSLTMNGTCAVVLAIAAIVTLILCVKYLSVQSEISEKTAYISELQKGITTMITQNDAIDYSINSYVDKDYIYKIATEELGMVVAGENQVKLFDSTELEYMKQLADIPSK